MKRFFGFLLLFVALAFPGRAQDDGGIGARLVARLGETVREWGSYRAEFTAEVPGQGALSGDYLVSGDRYRIRVEDGEQFSDGKARYEINRLDREVAIDRVDLTGRNILSNPTRAFDLAGGEYVIRHVGRHEEYGIACDVVELTPRADSGRGESILLYLRTDDGLPAAIEYLSEGVGMRIAFTAIGPVERPGDGEFRFRKADYPDYEVIDFR